MKVSATSEQIKNALVHADRATGKNLTLPILSSVLCIAGNKALTFRATNLSIGVEITIPAKIEKEGVVAVPGALLLGFFNALKRNEEVTLEQIGETLVIKSKQAKVQIKTFPYEDFPTIPTIEGQKVQVPAETLLQGLESVYYACAQSDIKPELGSVYIYPEDNSLTFVATDSFRLAEKKVKVSGLYGFQPVLIPQKNVVELIRILAGVTEPVSLLVGKNLLSMIYGGYYITSRVVDGAFPDYRKIFPKEKNTEVIILKNELIQAIKGTTLFSDTFNQITLTFDPGAKTAFVSAKNSDVGENETSIDATLTGAPISIVINYRYLLDALNAIPVDSISLEFTAENRAFTVRGVGDASFMYLIMPMNR